jgi:hypothetical protein
MPSVGGVAGMRNLGVYAAGTTYFPNDIVTFSGSVYIATATTAGNAPTNTSFWSLFLQGVSGTGVASNQKWSSD